MEAKKQRNKNMIINIIQLIKSNLQKYFKNNLQLQILSVSRINWWIDSKSPKTFSWNLIKMSNKIKNKMV